MRIYRNEQTGIVSLENVKSIKSVTMTQIKIDYMNGECAFINHKKGEVEVIFDTIEKILTEN